MTLDAGTASPTVHDDDLFGGLFGPWAAQAALQVLAASSALAPGTHLGPYVIEGIIASGGMGEVYRAIDTRLDRHVAVKLVDRPVVDVANWEQAVFAEARTIASLAHPSICRLYDVGEADERLYLVMELIDGESLAQRLARGPLPRSEALHISLAILAALEYAHARGIVHRDVKPGNVMLTTTGPRLLDFGIAAQIDQAHAVLVAGTRRYQAPEQASGTPDPRSDLYSFGIMLTEMIAGRPNGPNPPRPDEHERQLGGRLARVLQRCLEPSLASRWPSAGDLRRVLEAEMHRGSRIRTRLAVAAVVAAVVLLGVIVWRTEVPPATPSVAVLPLVDASLSAGESTPSDTAFADQVTEEIVRQLQAASNLRVIAFASTERLRGTTESTTAIAMRFAVTHVVDGRLERQSDATLRLQLRLLDASGRLVTQVTEAAALRDVGRLWGQVAGTLATSLGAHLPAPAAAATRPVRPDAWSAYAQGRRLCAAVFSGRVEDTPPDTASARALEWLEQAVRLDGEFAPAYAARASCLWSRFTVGYGAPNDLGPRIRDAALRAIRFDPSSAEAHAFVGAVRRDFDWDWEGAESAFRRALALEPGSAAAHTQFGSLLAALGRFDEAVREGRRGAELDPGSPMSTVFLPFALLAAGDYPLAAREYAALLERDPNLGPAWAQYAWVLHQLHRDRNAADAYGRARAFFPAGVDHVEDGWLMSEMRVVEGDAAVKALVQRWIAESSRRYVDPYNLAGFAVAAGDVSGALAHLQRAFDERSPSIFFIKAEPLLAPIRGRLEYRAIVRSMGLADR